MTKPEFDKLYNEKIARGLDFPLDDLLSKINELGDYSKVFDILAHITAHEMARKIFNNNSNDGQQNAYITNYRVSLSNYSPKLTISLDIEIHDSPTI